MRSIRLRPSPPPSTGKTLILAAIGIIGAFVGYLAALLRWGGPSRALEPVVFVPALFVITVLAVSGTALLLRLPPEPRRIGFTDLAFILVGLLISIIGVPFCAGAVQELLESVLAKFHLAI